MYEEIQRLHKTVIMSVNFKILIGILIKYLTTAAHILRELNGVNMF